MDSFVDSLKPVVNEMHVHPSSPNSSQSEDDAATKIQAGFRGYRVRKQMRQTRSSGSSSGSAATSSGSSSQVQRSPRVAKKVTTPLEDKSAAKIQAGVRGFLVRKRQKVATDAATKIQASFRGFKTRKDLKTTTTTKKDK